MSDPSTFTYVGFEIDVTHCSLRCHYACGGEDFTETVTIPDGDLSQPGVEAAAVLYFLLAGVSYLKTRAPLVVDLGSLPSTPAERSFLRTYLVEGLGEFALKNDLDLSAMEISGPEGLPAPEPTTLGTGSVLIPFGGGLDSIVTVAELAGQAERAALFVAERPGARFAAIEEAAAVTGLTVIRAERSLDPKVLESATRGYLNGHVPVTGVLSALAVLTAMACGFEAVAMSNERSASSATTQGPSGPVNHQWSKGADFEAGFRTLVAGRIQGLEYFSWLRDRSEVSIAEVFAGLDEYHHVFRSCNRAFHQDPNRRLDDWCGVCDKCLFIDLVLAPHLTPEQLRSIFSGREPLENPDLSQQLRVLVGASDAARPFECVGDEAECREALLAAASRPDRSSDGHLQALAEEVRRLPELSLANGSHPDVTFIPERYATPNRLD
ncbi:MAG: hypothetical protein WCI12_00270 [Actinomycetes bacterium]